MFLLHQCWEGAQCACKGPFVLLCCVALMRVSVVIQHACKLLCAVTKEQQQRA
jgi:hypothetical protein